jgi:hypothetical protein
MTGPVSLATMVMPRLRLTSAGPPLAPDATMKK